jgi:DNA-binding protein HU-beta
VNKGELIGALEQRLGSRKLATDAVESMIDPIVRTVVSGDRVSISGFGTFEQAERAARTGRNPRTGTPVRIKKTTVPKFKPGTAFKAYVESPRSIPAPSASGVAVTSRGIASVATRPAVAAPAKDDADSKPAKAPKTKPAKSQAKPAKEGKAKKKPSKKASKKS